MGTIKNVMGKLTGLSLLHRTINLIVIWKECIIFNYLKWQVAILIPDLISVIIWYISFLMSWKWLQSLQITKFHTLLNQLQCENTTSVMTWKPDSDYMELQKFKWSCQNKKRMEKYINLLIKTIKNRFFILKWFNS